MDADDAGIGGGFLEDGQVSKIHDFFEALVFEPLAEGRIKMLTRLLGQLGIMRPYPEFLAGKPETKTVHEVDGVKFVAFVNRAELRPGARFPLVILVENAHNTSRRIKFSIAASSPAADAGLTLWPNPATDLKDGETGMIMVPVQVSAAAPPGPRTLEISAAVRFENLGERVRPRSRRAAVACTPESPYCLNLQVTQSPPAAKPPASSIKDFSYFELWNTRDIPGPQTIVDQVWNSIRVIISKES